MRILLDTNVVIYLAERNEAYGKDAARLLGLGDGSSLEFVVHPSSVLEATNPKTISQLESFTQVNVNESPSREFLELIETNDAEGHTDDALLYALHGGDVDLLVTEDRQIHAKAQRASIHDRVLFTGQAQQALTTLLKLPNALMPGATRTNLFEVPVEQGFFDSLRTGYPKFDDWYQTKCVGRRHAWIVGDPSNLDALCIVKVETDDTRFRNWLKLCTFKVDPGSAGQHFGELLIKASFDEALTRNCDGIFVEVAREHEPLIEFLSNLGFVDTGFTAEKSNDLIFGKTLEPPDSSSADRPIVELQVLHWPWLSHDAPIHAIPIQPHWHHLLFPDAPSAQQQLDTSSNLAGHGIRKAYLCHAPTTKLNPGDVVVFYESAPVSAITSLGFVEYTFRSNDPAEIAARVAKRTVYDLRQIEEMCARGEVLVVAFRQTRHLSSPLSLTTLRKSGVVAGPWQSISEVTAERRVTLQSLVEIQ